MDLISVIVPVYNVEKYLNRCVDSIINQTYSNLEIILINDGSTDTSGKICDEYKKRDNRIQVIHQKNGGLSAARNAGIDIATGKYLTFIDSDDWIHLKYIEILYGMICTSNSLVSICSYKRVSTKVKDIIINDVKTMEYDAEYFYQKYPTISTIAPGKLYEKSCFENIRYPIGKIHEDEFVTYKILFNTKNIIFTDLELYNYFINENGIMRSEFSIGRYDAIEAAEERVVFFKKIGKYNLAEKEKQEICNCIAYYSILSRKSKIYKYVPKKYRMTWLKAMWILNTKIDKNRYEYIMYDYYPKLVVIQSYIRKIISILELKK